MAMYDIDGKGRVDMVDTIAPANKGAGLSTGHAYQDMKFEIPDTAKISSKMHGKLLNEYTNSGLKAKQKAQYLRTVYFKQ